jgi:hypothetical protein
MDAWRLVPCTNIRDSKSVGSVRRSFATGSGSVLDYSIYKARGALSGIEESCWHERLPVRKRTKGINNTMKRILLSIVLAVAAPFAWAQVSETTTTTTTTEGNGTITEYSPGSTIVLKETSGPRTYRFGKTVTYVTRSGKVLDETIVKTRVKVGVPVRVHYVGTGDSMMVDRVILDED